MSSIVNVADLASAANIAGAVDLLLGSDTGLSIARLYSTASSNLDPDKTATEYIIPNWTTPPTFNVSGDGFMQLPTNLYFQNNEACFYPKASSNFTFIGFTGTLRSNQAEAHSQYLLIRREIVDISDGTISSDATLARVRIGSFPVGVYSPFSIFAVDAAHKNTDQPNKYYRYYLQMQNAAYIADLSAFAISSCERY